MFSRLWYVLYVIITVDMAMEFESISRSYLHTWLVSLT